MKLGRSRRGVASVVGTVFFVVVFMLALGSLAYAYGLQQQTAAAQEQEVLVASARGNEELAYSLTPSGLEAVNSGPATVVVNHVLLRFPNGTVYSLEISAAIPSSGEIPIEGLMPVGAACPPGSDSCASKLAEVTAGDPAGSSVGLVTSLGNVFWFTRDASEVGWDLLTGFPAGCPPGTVVSALNTTLACSTIEGLSSWLEAPVTSGVPGSYASTGLGVTLAPNGTYAFLAFTVVEPVEGVERYDFALGPLPAGASLEIACSPMAYPAGGGSLPTNCVTSAGTPIAAPNSLGFGVTPPVYATPGVFGVVKTGALGGSLELEFACTENCGGVTMMQGSFMLVQPLE